MNKRIEFNELQNKLLDIPSWEYSSEYISKTYTFNNFKQAINFTQLVGDAAEELDHHPDILIFGWNKVRITLSTHSAKGLTQLDFDLSDKIEKIFNNLK